MENILRYFLLSFLLQLLTGCGYQAGSLSPYGLQTVFVPVFENHTLHRGYEFALTRAIIAELLTKTTFQIKAPEHADTVLEGAITKIGQSTVTKDESRLATQFDVAVSVSITWKDLRTGKPIVAALPLSETIQVIAGQGESLDSAIAQALRKLARAIVFSMESPYLLGK